MEASGELVRVRKGRYAVPRAEPDEKGSPSACVGTISFQAGGTRRAGFFSPDPECRTGLLKNSEGDIYVPASLSGTALHGDRVEVMVAEKEAPRWHRHVKRKRERADFDQPRLQARIVRVIERKNARVTGVYHRHGRYAHLEPDHPNLPPVFNLTRVLPEARPGDVVVAEFEGWDSPRIPPRARMIEVLGPPDSPGVDILTVIHRHNLPLHFPGDVEKEATRFSDEVDPAEAAVREDWRDREVFTIDPEDAKDFDDAVFVHEFHPDEGGGWELAVHIADVSHYVRTDTALDREAKMRGNSVYLADRVIPMLPEKLSNGLCSLKPGVDRLTHAVVMRFSETGKMTAARFAAAVIRSRRRFTYEEAFGRLNLSEGEIDFLSPEEASLARHVKRAWKLAARLRERRFHHGSLDLDFPEVRAVLDERGIPIEVRRIEHDESHQLIEEFMLAANEAVALETKSALAPSVYRVHEDPDPEKLLEFAEQARSYGHAVGDLAVRAELQKLLRAIRGKPEEHALKIALLKSLKRAAYRADPLGHYGLAKNNYTHFTSPIRRYADLVVHRVLRKLVLRREPEAEAGESPDGTPSHGRMAEIAKHISETERVAADAEQETQRLKLIEYLVRLGESGERKFFEGVVYEVRPIGAFVELTDLFIKGLVRKEDFPPGDVYRLDGARQRFVSRYGRFQLAVGHRVRVRVLRVDRSRGFVDFELVR